MLSLTLDEGVKEVGNECFKGINLVKINLPKSVKSIGNYAFFLCKNLANVIL